MAISRLYAEALSPVEAVEIAKVAYIYGYPTVQTHLTLLSE